MGFQLEILRSKSKQKLANDQGAAAVEFALLLPVLTLMLVGMMIFGLLLNSYLEITHAAREGVRWATLGDSRAVVETKTQAASPGIDWSKATFDHDTDASDPPELADQGKAYTLTVTYEIDDLKSLFGPFGTVLPDTIKGSATQRVE